MAYRRRKATRKPARRARRGRAKKTTLLNTGLTPLPARFLTTMKYSTNLATSGVTGTYQMNLNSLYDPDRSGIGHQPLGFDNLALLYNKYRVISTSYRIHRCASATDPAIQIATIPSNDPSILWSVNWMKESPRCKYIVQNPGSPSQVLRGVVNLPALTGRTKSQYMADDIFGSDVLSNPAEECILYIQTSTATGDIQGNVNVSVVMTFQVEWYDPKQLIQS